MSLQDKMSEDMKQAMRDGNTVARDTLRMVLADLKNKVVELRTSTGKTDVELTEDDVQAVLVRAVKTRRDSVQEYDKNGRPELAAQERAEIAVIEGYLPKQLGADETKAAVKALVDELGLTSMKEIGQVMKGLKAKFGPAVDGKLAQQAARELLS